MPSTTTTRRVIIAAQCNDHSVRLAGIPSRRFYTDARTFARIQLLVSEYYGLDAPNNTWDVYNIEAEAMGQKTVYPVNSMPDVDRIHPLIKSHSSLGQIQAPDPYTSGRMPWVHQVNKTYIELTGKPARVSFCAPFSLAVNVRGYENLITDMMSHSAFVHRLFGFLCDEVLVPYIEAMRSEIGRPAILADGNDAWASPPLVTLDMVAEYVVPYTERLREAAGGKVVTRGNWGDAQNRDPERFMAQKLEASPGFLSVLDPDLHELGPHRVKAFALKHNAHVTAGIDGRLIRNGPIQDITERIKQYIDGLARDGRCAIYLNHIPADTPPEHIHAAVAACHTYGRFPIAENLDDIKVEIPQKESFGEFLRRKGVTLDA